MGRVRKAIAICGTWLYEEKEFHFVSELNKICREKGYVPIAFNFSVDAINAMNDEILEEKLMELMGYLKCEAVIIMGETVKSERMQDSIMKTVRRMHVPVFATEKHIDGCINVAMKYGEGFQNIVRHVIEKHGCRKINMIAGVKDNEFSEDRIQAYKDVLAEYGIPFEEKRLAYGDFWDRPARDATKAFLQDPEWPDAIVCANDSMAIAACSVLAERGIRVPEDMIVTGFDGIVSAKVNIPSISTVAPDNHGELEIIFDLLNRIQRGEEIDISVTHYVEFKIQPSRSCGCLPHNDSSIVNSLSTSLSDQKWHMAALNKMLLAANDIDEIPKLPALVKECVDLWAQNLYFVSIYKHYLDAGLSVLQENSTNYIRNTTCFNLMQIQDYADVSKGEVFDESILMPELDKMLSEDSGFETFMVRLLHTQFDTYGYLIEGFRTLDERAMRRCEEFGLFLSTAFNIVLKNRKLMLLNERLVQINREMEQASVRDYLTSLYNRRGFYEELYKQFQAPENQNRYLTYFSIDMDGLKKINDTYGHNEGDFALKALASAIKNFAMRNGICARYGGDEFTCAIVTDQETHFTADTVRERFQFVFQKNEELQEKPYAVSASVGFRCARIEPGLNLEELMREADESMYSDKKDRKKNREA